MSKSFDIFMEIVARAGLTALDRGNGHWQITGGAMLVNYYPQRGTIYVAGTVGKVRGGIQKAIAAAKNPPKMIAKCSRDGWSSNSRRIRRRLLKRSSACHWCGIALTLDTSTIDHRIPLSRGGLDNDNNRVLACEPCNTHRGSDMPELKAVTAC